MQHPEPEPFKLVSIGARIRRIRQTRGLSVQALAAETGTSSAMISQVERGVTSPSLETLWRISNALNVAMFQFFDDQSTSRVVVTRPQERLRFVWQESPMNYCLLSPAAGRQMVMFLLKLDAGARTEARVHPGEEGGVILRGTLEVEADGARHLLEEGDSIYFDSTSPHSFYNPGDKPVEAIWSMTANGIPANGEIGR